MTLIYNITPKALKQYEQIHKGYIDHTKELQKRRLSAHILSCEACKMYRDISATKSVYSIGNLHIVLDGETIEEVYTSKGRAYVNPKYDDYMKHYCKQLGITTQGKQFIKSVL